MSATRPAARPSIARAVLAARRGPLPDDEALRRNVERLRDYLDRQHEIGEVAVPIVIVRSILGRP